MNKSQRRLTWITLGLFISTLLLTPVIQTKYHWSSVTPIFAVDADYAIRFEILFVEWLALAIIYTGLFLIFRKPHT